MVYKDAVIGKDQKTERLNTSHKRNDLIRCGPMIFAPLPTDQNSVHVRHISIQHQAGPSRGGVQP